MRLAGSLLLSGILVVALLQAYKPQQRLTDSIVFEFNEGFNSYSADTLRLMSFGYGRMMGSLLWLRFLGQTPPKKVEKDQVSWIYRDLDAISEIDPYFFPVYEHGGIFLSVITEDKRGAEQILLKGIKMFPDRWRIRAYLAYHYQFELNEPEKAAEQYRIGATLPGAVSLLGLLASSFINKAEGPERSIAFLEGLMKDMAENSEQRKRFEHKIAKLRAGEKNAK